MQATYINGYKQGDSSWMGLHPILGWLQLGVYACAGCLIPTIAIGSQAPVNIRCQS